jgi:dihydrofolate synthase/folylpolyglutamate synthase
MGNPEKDMRIIHVAGTNGKGSVCAYMNSILREAGYSVSVFTSPHLVDIRERFMIRDEMISKEEFLDTFLIIYNMLDWDALSDDSGTGYHPTFFEYLFFMAMLIFKKAATDFCILETGLGGRLDATNAVSVKELSVITRIGLDHVQYLGDTVEKIAGEKAGIIMQDVPVVYLDSSREVSQIFERRSAALDAKTYSVSKNDYALNKITNKSIDFSLHTRYYGYVGLKISSIATYQPENAALAVRAMEVLDEASTISKDMIINGISKAFWQGRMEEILPNVYIDGAHNEDGIRAFLDTVENDGYEGGRLLLFGAVADKDIDHMISRIVSSGMFERAAIVHLKTGRAADTDRLAEIFGKDGFTEYDIYEDSGKALKSLLRIQQEADGHRRIYIAGSLYLVGEIKEFLINDKF